MNKYEYITKNIMAFSDQKVVEELNKLGEQGWSVVFYWMTRDGYAFVILMRELEATK